MNETTLPPPDNEELECCTGSRSRLLQVPGAGERLKE